MSAVPRFVYKLLPDAPPLPLPATPLPLSELDSKDQFIHLSNATQLVGTASRYFAKATTIYVLKIELSNDTVAPFIKWELSPSRGEEFAHLYGPDGGPRTTGLSAKEVSAVKSFTRTVEQFWEEVLTSDSWVE